jgi:hypothetical protein
MYYLNAKEGRGRKGCPVMGFNEMGRADDGHEGLDSRTDVFGRSE